MKTLKICCFFNFNLNRELGEKTSDDELRAMINEFDKDGDGESKYKSSFQLKYESSRLKKYIF